LRGAAAHENHESSFMMPLIRRKPIGRTMNAYPL
jgi:hypothetical protein